MQQKASEQLEVKLDNNLYDDSQLVELKLPMHLAYQNDQPEYQRCNGEVELNGTLYQYVKRKLADDTLYLMCIPNSQKMHLETAKNDFFKMANDIQNNSKKSDNSKTIAFKNLQGEYDEYSFAIKYFIESCDGNISHSVTNNNHLLSSPHVSPEQPPDYSNIA